MPQPSLLTQTRLWLKKHEIRVSKRLGQHFLISEPVLEHLIQYANLSEKHQVLEIGAGNGVLTRALADSVQQVYSIEKDSQLFQILSKELQANPKITLIHGDAVKITWPVCNYLIANLPYSISSPVLFRFYESEIPMALLMLQKEFAERLEAKPGSKHYSRLTVMTAYHATVEVLEIVSPRSFYPSPEVSSAIVRIKQRRAPPFQVRDLAFFAHVTTTLFNQRRKKIRSPLKALVRKAELKELQEKIPWLDHRVEELTPEQIAVIANTLYEDL